MYWTDKRINAKYRKWLGWKQRNCGPKENGMVRGEARHTSQASDAFKENIDQRTKRIRGRYETFWWMGSFSKNNVEMSGYLVLL